MVFAEHEVPVAHSMIARAELLKDDSDPLDRFTCYWTAFNNIYVTIADQLGRRPQLMTNPDGSVRTRTIGRVHVPVVSTVTEREQLELAYRQFPDELKQGMIEHPSAYFFAHRVPRWHGQLIEEDATGQRLNGVLNVGHTIDPKYPVWSPIDMGAFEEYLHGTRYPEQYDALALQILNVLYAVRNNAFHGGKRADDANDREVLEKALPLVAMIVTSFVRVGRAD